MRPSIQRVFGLGKKTKGKGSWNEVDFISESLKSQFIKARSDKRFPES